MLPPRARLGRLTVLLYGHPFELAFGVMLLMLAARTVGIVGAQPLVYDAALPDYVRQAYAAGTITGGIGILIGLIWPNRPAARAVEKAGLYLVASVLLAYGYALINLAGVSGNITGAIQVVMGIACLLRAEAIRLTERVVLNELRARNADPDGRPPHA